MNNFLWKTNSPNGMNFTIIELKEIIEHCSNFGVTRIKLDEVEIDFVGGAQNISHPISPETTRAQARQNQASLKDEEKNLRDDQIANLLVEDPVRYEEMLAQGEILDETRGT